ncbi:hypothetical protein DFH07DRAFT_824512 [Mycena maculata]|uniref:DUF6534 domain-containing protein n=1 Tax=Mycena maculata TaxID=230809 RepID=A0AAD7IYE5_9AGAR|nr:hypothetical protein DFH07DRAFT_824512 [Mycena maculata]
MSPAAYLVSAAAPDAKIVQMSGPLIVSFLLSWGLFGTLSVQLYLYYQAFPNDRTFAKLLVYTVYLIEFAATIILTHDAFSIYGYGFADVSALTNVYFFWLDVPIMGGLVAFFGQSFYAYRVHVLSEKGLLIPCLIVAISLTGTVAAFIIGAFILEAGSVTNLEVRQASVAGGVWLGASAICDITIAVCMTYYLTKSDTGFLQTRELVSRLTRLIIETGTLTAVVAVCTIILFLAYPRNNYYTAPLAILPQLYANTILVILNSRIKIAGGRRSETSSDIMSTIPLHFRSIATNAGTEQSLIIEIRRAVSDANVHNQVEIRVMNASQLDSSI